MHPLPRLNAMKGYTVAVTSGIYEIFYLNGRNINTCVYADITQYFQHKRITDRDCYFRLWQEFYRKIYGNIALIPINHVKEKIIFVPCV